MVTSFEECLNGCQGTAKPDGSAWLGPFTHFAFGCPTSNGAECWCCNGPKAATGGGSLQLADSECLPNTDPNYAITSGLNTGCTQTTTFPFGGVNYPIGQGGRLAMYIVNPDTDCAGAWSACTSACELGADRVWTETTAQGGAGAACPTAAPDCLEFAAPCTPRVPAADWQAVVTASTKTGCGAGFPAMMSAPACDPANTGTLRTIFANNLFMQCSAWCFHAVGFTTPSGMDRFFWGTAGPTQVNTHAAAATTCFPNQGHL